jgi:uncharacterized protein (TIGR02996 family)
VFTWGNWSTGHWDANSRIVAVRIILFASSPIVLAIWSDAVKQIAFLVLTIDEGLFRKKIVRQLSQIFGYNSSMVDPADAAFLRTILAAPDEDTPRLVYADYLEEKGQFERAEFIRIQCELARTPSFFPRYPELTTREQELLALHQAEWKYRLPILRGVHWEEFHRGFVSNVRIEDPYMFFAYSEEIFAAAPIGRLRVHGFDAQIAQRFADRDVLEQVRYLDLEDGNRIGNEGLEALATSPYLKHLRVLKVRGNRIGLAGIRALASSPMAESLRTLDLDENELYEDGARFLAESSKLTGLKSLSMERTRAGTAGAVALAQSPYLINLHSLYLTQNDIDADGAIAIAEATHHAKLRNLNLTNNRIGDSGAVALAMSPVLDGCLHFYLRNNGIGNVGALALARSPQLGKVVELILGENLISGEVAQVMRERFGKRLVMW